LAGIAPCLPARGARARGSLGQPDGRNGFKGFVPGGGTKNHGGVKPKFRGGSTLARPGSAADDL